MLALVLCQAGTVAAATFSVDPTQIRLSAQVPSALLTIRNDSAEPVRMQLAAFAWDQSPGGDMQLQRTGDIVFFPALFTLAPGQERRIRVGTTASFAATERSYRLFLEELPPDPSGAPPGSGVQMLTKISLPIFLRPGTATAGAALGDVGLARGVLSFRVLNTGTVHFTPDAVRVRGVGARGEPVIDRQIDAWYLLAGGSRLFTLGVPTPECDRVRSFAIDVTVNGTVLSERLETPGGTCIP